ncbi:hypothetical protein niasHS_005398 [Heterodera schachtii]|uniref:Cyclin N-terminal domain-containing protein n=1 Tax=Heterodera schachtii TaxID=97005 RepID=A0ABD2J9C0_HETSC
MNNAGIHCAVGSPLCYQLTRVLLNSLLCKERVSFSKQHKKHPNFSERNRQIRWILSVGRRWALGLNTLGLSIAILDRVLDRLKVQGKYLNCIAVASLCLGIKFHEEVDARSEAFETHRQTAMLLAIPSPETMNSDDLAAKIRSTSNYTQKELNRMERTLLSHLEWDLLLPSFDRFLHAMLAVIGAPHLAGSKVLRQNFEIVISSGQLVSVYPSSVLALSLLSLMLELTPQGSMAPYITQNLSNIFQIQSVDLLLCRQDIALLIANFWASRGKRSFAAPIFRSSASPLPPTCKCAYSIPQEEEDEAENIDQHYYHDDDEYDNGGLPALFEQLELLGARMKRQKAKKQPLGAATVDDDGSAGGHHFVGRYRFLDQCT